MTGSLYFEAWLRCFVTAVVLIVCAAPALLKAEEETAQTAWELAPYRIQVLTAVDADAVLPLHFENDLHSDLPAQARNLVGGSWRLEATSAASELRYRILNAISDIKAGDIPAASRKGDKVILLGIRVHENGYQALARELDVVTGLWNTTVSREVRQAGNLKQDALRGILAAFAPIARIEKVEDKIVTLRLRAAALVRRDASLPLLMPGTVFRPVLVKSDGRGAVKPGEAEPIAWTFFTPTDARPNASPFTCRTESGLSSVIPDYHPTRQRWAIGVSPSKHSTRLRLVAEGKSAAPLEGYEVAAQDWDLAGGKLGALQSLGRSGPDGVVVVPPGLQTVRMLLVRHGEEVLARLPVVPGLAEEITIPLADDGPRLAIETALSRIQDDLLDLVARREVLASRIRAAGKGQDAAAADKLKDQLRRLPFPERVLAELGQQQQALDTLEGQSRQKMQKKLVEIRKLAEKLKSENPASKL